MNPHLEQRIANRVKVEVAEMVQIGNETPDPDAIDPDHKLVDQLRLDSLDLCELSEAIEERLALADSDIDEVALKPGATVHDVIQASLRAYEDAHGEREVV